MSDEGNFDEEDSLKIAIVGMAGRFPGAADIWRYWDNIAEGVNSIRDITPEELAASGVPKHQIENPNYVARVPVLENADCFDARFFGYSPREAQAMDPQQRIFLELCWEALEHAGYSPGACACPVGVFAGSAMNSYLLNAGLASRFREDYLPTLLGGDKDYLATRVAFKLDLRGPAMTIQTACSSSLVAIHTACQSLLNRECDMALAGGAAVRVPLLAGHIYEEGSVFSPDGHVRAFDQRANGTVFGSGAGAIVLKRLQSALDDGDPILAVIQGSAINNDGASKSEFTAPSLSAQADLIVETLAIAGVAAESVSYIEAHGTGTFLGDPIEVAALNRAYRSQTENVKYCSLGAVKANIGHLDAAAGVAGVIKVVLALQHKKLPPLIGYSKANPEIDFENSPFYINAGLIDWKPINGIRRAGVTSLGIGGTNAHIIIDGPPEGKTQLRSDPPPAQIFPVACKSEQSLENTSLRLAAHFERHTTIDPADAAYTLQQRLGRFRYRRAVIGDSLADVASRLVARDKDDVFEQVVNPLDTVFLFSGQGSQHPGMGKDLYKHYEAYQSAFDSCTSILEELGHPQIRELILVDEDADIAEASQELALTQNTQPALFTVEFALAKLWQSLGVEPHSMIGHSIGEYVAATLAGVFTLRDALAIVAERGRLMQSMEPGWMMAVSAEEDILRSHLPDSVSIAVQNGADLYAIGGPFSQLETITRQFDELELPYRMLRTSHAFHSAMMEPMLEEFRSFVSRHGLEIPQIRFASNVTGDWISDDQATSPGYWAQHIRSTVRFSDGLNTVLQGENAATVEMGPGQVLTALVMQHRSEGTVRAIPSLPRADSDKSDHLHFLGSVARFWAVGGELDWLAVSPQPQSLRRVSLPGYAFERVRHWPDPALQDRDLVVSLDSKPMMYSPSWVRSKSLRAEHNTQVLEYSWLVFISGSEFGKQFVDFLEVAGAELITVEFGQGFNTLDDTRFTVGGQNLQSYISLLQAVKDRASKPLRTVHLWNTGNAVSAGQRSAERDQAFDCFVKLFAAAEQVLDEDLDLLVITQAAQQVSAEDPVQPIRAMVEPTCRALTRENPGARALVLDLDPDGREAGSLPWPMLLSLEPEVRGPLAVRGGFLWRRSYEPVEAGTSINIREDGVYLITGGLGGIGRRIAAHWASEYGARVIVMSRSDFPPKALWLSESKRAQLPDQQRHIAELFAQATESRGDIDVMSGDVTQDVDVARIVKTIIEQYGQLNGVVHGAGTIDPGLCSQKSVAEIDAVLAPKLDGTLCLLDGLANLDLDFVALFSSVRSLQAPMGLVDYAAANAFMDAISETNSTSLPLLSINWPGWQGVGMLGGADYEDSLSEEEGLRLLGEALRPSLRRIAVSRQVASKIHLADEPQQGKPDVTLDPLSMEINASASNTERAVLGIWIEELGVKQISLADNFFELGGSSLMAARCLSTIKQKLGVKLGLKAFLSAPTPGELAFLIEEQAGK